MEAIARSDGSRASVLHGLRTTRTAGGVLGSSHFDAAGDITPAPIVILRVTGGHGASALGPDFKGAVVDRTVRVPLALLRADS